MKKFVAYFIAFAVALFCAAAILSPAIAGAEEVDFHEAYGKIVAIDFESSEVFVETSDGEIYSFFAERYIRTQDQVYLLLFRDEVIDVIFISDLEGPFGGSSFFYFYENTAEPTAE